jgi:hypothetical protein
MQPGRSHGFFRLRMVVRVAGGGDGRPDRRGRHAQRVLSAREALLYRLQEFLQ